MKRNRKMNLWVSVSFLAAFVIWTVLICIVDVQAVGPNGSQVGFAAMNKYIHELVGVNMSLYTVTDWLGIIPIAVALCFAVFGLVQWIKRKSILKVDRSLLVLGGFYAAVIVVFVFFEIVVINYRPILIEGQPEASYPSSTTLLAMCVIPTAMMQIISRIKSKGMKAFVAVTGTVFTAFMVVGRVLAGVHWSSDIIGGILFSIGLVNLYQLLHDECK